VRTASPWPQVPCPACGEPPRAPWPAGVPRGTDGPRVHATGAQCPGASRLSPRPTGQGRGDLFGVPRRGGSSSQAEQAPTAVFAPPVQAARAGVETPAVAHLEATSGRQGDKRAWLGVAGTSLVPVLLGRLSRGGQGARELLGERCSGSLGTARSSASHGDPVRGRQRCGAPLLRDFAARRGREGGAEESGAALRGQAHQMVGWWPRVGEGTWPRATWRAYMRPLRPEGDRLLAVGSQCGGPKTAGTGRERLTRRAAWWTCVQVEGGEPTKNTAERSIRPGVQGRKGRFGTQREEGSRCVASLRTGVATRKHQQRNVLAYLPAAPAAALRGAAVPSRLPARAVESQAVA
jgi:transposase